MKKLVLMVTFLLLLVGCTEEKPDPVLVLKGNETVNIAYGGEFVEAGAVLQNGPEDVTITRKGTVNTLISGEYTLLYEATYEEITYQTTRTVVVAAPVDIEYYLQGEEYVVHPIGEQYQDPGVYLSILALQVDVTDDVDLTQVGTYTINFHITVDEEVDTLTRTLIVIDPNEFNFFLLGPLSVSVAVGETYDDLGYYLSDATLAVNTTNSVDTSAVGTYEVVYTVEHNSELVTLTRTVQVTSE